MPGMSARHPMSTRSARSSTRCSPDAPPSKAKRPWRPCRQVADEDPVPPTRLVPRLERDLETICLKCLSKEPSKRYASASELADDLERHLAGEPIKARPTSWWEHGVKWARRRPALATLAALSLAASLMVAATGFWLVRREHGALNALRREVVPSLLVGQALLAREQWSDAKEKLIKAHTQSYREPELVELHRQVEALLDQAARGQAEQDARDADQDAQRGPGAVSRIPASPGRSLDPRHSAPGARRPEQPGGNPPRSPGGAGHLCDSGSRRLRETGRLAGEPVAGAARRGSRQFLCPAPGPGRGGGAARPGLAVPGPVGSTACVHPGLSSASRGLLEPWRVFRGRRTGTACGRSRSAADRVRSFSGWTGAVPAARLERSQAGIRRRTSDQTG